MSIRIWLAAGTVLVGVAAAPASDERAQFNRLVDQRNELYAQLTLLHDDRAPQDETKWVQKQIDLVELRLDDIGGQRGWEVPRLRRDSDAKRLESRALAMAAPPGAAAAQKAKPRAEFNKLVYKRNKLHARLVRLDAQAADLLKGGENPIIVYAEQVSVQDQLDLVELRLAMLSTRHGLSIPPLPGSDSMRSGGRGASDDASGRSARQAFARGHERAVNKLRADAEHFLASLDFGAFLHH